MSSGVYLAVMLGVIALLSAIFVPALVWKKCAKCGVRNALDNQECKACKHPFPED